MCNHLFFILFCMTAATAAGASPYLSRVLEYMPAPGQFVNEMPEYEPGDTYEDILRKAEEQICGARQPGMISLGAFGGYVTVAFDHPVVNVRGCKDFKIYGNALPSNAAGTTGSSEPGIVWVSVDENGNGLPDDTWYQLAGSEHFKGTERKEYYGLPLYSCVYFRPSDSREPEIATDGEKTYDPDPVNVYITDRRYIMFEYADGSWTSNELHVDYLRRVSFHTQPYWPRWVTDDEAFFLGSRLPDNFTDLSAGGVASYSQKPYDWGYADNLPNNECEGFDLDWAVDRAGNHVSLTHADFIRVQTGVMQQCGWLGESSTEVSGGEDLHPEATPADVRCVRTDTGICGVYTLDGINVSDKMESTGLTPGVYIMRRGSESHKILIR